MKVKCKICKREHEREDAYLHVHVTKSGKKQNQYYCSKEEFEKDRLEKEYYKECQYLLDTLFGEVITDNVRNKKLSELHKAGYSYEMIYNCIEDNRNKIENALILKKQDFVGNNAMYMKLAYVFGIIKKEIIKYEHEDVGINKLNKNELDKSEVHKPKRRELKESKCLMDIIKGGKK